MAIAGRGYLLWGLLLFTSCFLPAQRDIFGTITDRDGLPLVGASVWVAGQPTVGTVSDTAGRYALIVPPKAKSLVASYTGYTSRELPISADVIDFRLAEGIRLDELVVVGYGSQKRTDLTGAVAQVVTADLQQPTVAGIDAALQGRVPGLLLNSNTGQPGAGRSVRIRGSSSINASNAPLYVVDGIPMTTGSFTEFYVGGMDHNVLNDLSVTDIESVEVLRDAAAAAIYGSRASNGVVLITTKRGQAGDTEINFGYSYGLQSVRNEIEMLDGQQFSELTDQDWNGRDADFEGALFQTAPVSRYDLSLSGGDLKTKYYLSGSLFDQEGTIVNQRFDRLSGRLNFDHLATDWLTFNAGVGITRSRTNVVPSDDNLNGIITMLFLQPRNVDIRGEDGAYTLDGYFFANPVGSALRKTNLLTSRRTLLNVGAKVQLRESLSYQLRIGLDETDFSERIYDPASTFAGSGTNGQGFLNTTLASRAVYQNYLDYRTKFGKLNFTGVAGVDYETLDLNNTSLAGTGFPSDDFTFLASAADFTDASQDVSESRLLSLYTRLNFRYLGKYSLTATFRSDGSSRFGADNRFGYFPSVSLGWILHEEPFLQNLDWVNQLKLRVSYGLTGNQAGIGDFASRGLASGGNNYQGLAGISPVTFANVDLQWESTSELNLGLDFGIWGDRLHGSVDYYVKNTRDLLLLRPLPSSTGFEGINQNVGEIRNAGVELGLTGLIVDRDVRWTLRGMLAANRNEVTALFEGQGFSPVTFLPIRVDEGEPLAYFFGLRSLGVDPQTGDLIFEDVNGDGEIDDADNQRIGSPHPDFIGSLSSELTYKGLSLDVLVNFVQGNEILNFTRTFTEDGLLNGFNNSTRILDAWSAPGDVTDVPRIGGPNATANRNSRTSRWIEDGSFLRLKTVSLRYDFPAGATDKVGLSQLSVYVTGENLLTLTDYLGLDPEVNYAGDDNLTLGTDFFTQGLNRTVQFGLRGTF